MPDRDLFVKIFRVMALHRADEATGCLGIETLRNVDRPDEFVVISRWTGRMDFKMAT